MTENDTPTALPVLPLADGVVLPGMVVPIELDDAETQAALDAATSAAGSGTPSLLVVPRIDGQYAAVGTLAIVEQVGRLPGGQPAAVLRGTVRMKIGSGTTGPGAALWVNAEELKSELPTTSEGRAELADLTKEYKALVTTILQQRRAFQLVDGITKLSDPSQLADTAGYAPYLTSAQKLQVLSTADVLDRLRLVVGLAREHLAELDVAETIRKDVQEGMEKTQREFLLRQQLTAIRKELAELDGTPEAEAETDWRGRIEAADLPDDVRKAALREVDKLDRTSEQSPEIGWIRSWLETILDLPFGTRKGDDYTVTGAREVLDADHYGLDEVKDRIVEHLAVRARRERRGLGVIGGRRSGAVLALVGPPGVGKTSLGESVARAMGRDFVRVALGGVRDEAEIRGHRRTYVGALPGRIVRALREAGSMNPVVLLDEIDKVGSDYRGDPAAALLEVLDPEQNHTFRDHYLEVDLDLSDVVFLATANVLDSIPGPLLDRMEVLRLDGYTEDEKLVIAREHLLPRQLERAGFSPEDVTVTDDALRELSASYTHEAGVRDLERSVARILRKVAAADSGAPVAVAALDLRGYLGRPKHTPESGERTAVPGVATGLAVTGAGGDVLFVEASLTPGVPGLSLTGQLGDVMKESAQIALSYLRSHGPALGIPTDALASDGVHVHFPAGAIPKDGPSAGVTLITALSSLLTGRLVRSEVAMTGEVSLTGRVLPIGGVKQKLLAAHRAGITTVLIPARNEPDLDDVPASVLAELTVKLMADATEVIEAALVPETDAELLAA